MKIRTHLFILVLYVNVTNQITETVGLDTNGIPTIILWSDDGKRLGLQDR